MTIFTLHLYTDTICPWCYISRPRLLRAISLYLKTYCSTDTFNLIHASYQLSASASATTSIPVLQQFESRVGPDRVTGMRMRLDRVARSEGLSINWESRFGNSRDSHRLLWLAKRELDTEGQMRVLEEVERQYYVFGADITDISMLISAGVTCGMNRPALEAAMKSEEGGKEVDEEFEKARQKDFVGVPYLEIEVEGREGCVGVGGAEDVTVLYEVFGKLKEGAGLEDVEEVLNGGSVPGCEDGMCSM